MTGQLPRYGYLGPRGTFTQMALDRWQVGQAAEQVPHGSVDAALAALREGEIDAAVVPIENSVEGGVSATLDALASGDPLMIVGEVLVDVTFVIAAREPMSLQDIRAIGTHSHGWAQVRGWAERHTPGARYVATLSTAAAAEQLASGEAQFDAAVCAPVAATNHGLAVLAEDIGDMRRAVTRFVAVARPDALPERTGADKTTLVLYQREDRAGGLLELLEHFAARGINMTRLESRPTKDEMGSYCFSIDCEGHVLDERVGEALAGLKRVSGGVVFLGSYPRADRRPADIAPLAADADFTRARQWVETLRHHP